MLLLEWGFAPSFGGTNHAVRILADEKKLHPPIAAPTTLRANCDQCMPDAHCSPLPARAPLTSPRVDSSFTPQASDEAIIAVHTLFHWAQGMERQYSILVKCSDVSKW